MISTIYLYIKFLILYLFHGNDAYDRCCNEEEIKILNKFTGLTKYTLSRALMFGNTLLINYIIDRNPDFCTQFNLDLAVRLNNLEILKKFDKRRIDMMTIKSADPWADDNVMEYLINSLNDMGDNDIFINKQSNRVKQLNKQHPKFRKNLMTNNLEDIKFNFF